MGKIPLQTLRHGNPIQLTTPRRQWYDSQTSPVIAWINSQPALERTAKGIRALKSYRQPNVIDAIIAIGKSLSRLIKPQSFDEISWSMAQFCLESSTKVPRTERLFCC